ncbi:hypothetical protein [Parasphingorhabdus pacifica]
MRTSVRLLGVVIAATGAMAMSAPAFAVDKGDNDKPSITNESEGGDGGDGGLGLNVLSCLNVINALGDTSQECNAGAGGSGGDAATSVGGGD